ncbi:dihydrofolate reductase family protein [soil metagenome]
MISYLGITSLDGYMNDENGNFDWSEPDAEVHEFVNDLERTVGTYLFGRRMYEVMTAWDTMPAYPDMPYIADYTRIYQAADKVVFSTTLTSVNTPRTRLEPSFTPSFLKTIEGDVSIGGPTLAAQAIHEIDEFRMLVSPISVGGGTPYFPPGVTLPLELLQERRFGNGVVFLRYAPRR